MKRMNEVFELPVNGYSLRDTIFYKTSGADDEIIAHAINNVDALVESLERLVELSKLIGGGPAGLYSAVSDAESALAAYRGAK